VPLLLDGAHNPPAAVVLRRELDRRAAGGRVWLIGIQRHKDGAAVLRALIGPEDRALIVPIPDHRAWSLDELAAACPDLAGQLASVLGVEDGLQQLSGAAAGKSLPGRALPVVAGSLYLLGSVMTLLDPLPARSPAPTDAGGPVLGS
jgi:dihydrofolate synthase/folylpolyglutamate synthase